MESVEFNYNSYRAQKARIGHMMSGMWVRLLSVAAVVMILAGIAFLVLGQSIGWTLIGFAAIPAMLIEWYNNELKHLPSPKQVHTNYDVLSRDV